MFDFGEAVLRAIGGFKGDLLNTHVPIHSAASTNLTLVFGKVCTLGRITVINRGGAECFLKIYDKASAPNPAADTPKWSIPLAANGGFYDREFSPINLANGLAYSITAGVAITDTTAVAAGAVLGIIGYAP